MNNKPIVKTAPLSPEAFRLAQQLAALNRRPESAAVVVNRLLRATVRAPKERIIHA